MQASPSPLGAVDFESLALSGSVVTLDEAKVAACSAVLIQFQGTDGYYRLDNAAAVTAEAGGGLFAPEDSNPIFLERIRLNDFQAIAGAGFLVVQYLN